MLSISSPELIYFYHQAEKPVSRQVVEPSAGVRSQTADRSTQGDRRKTGGGNVDFSSVFAKALTKR
ncbi:MAG: hypothetical protein H7838_09475 [Magnetococcus sp. DMHC-8]